MSGAVIRRFKINGLYGYKDVEITFNDNLLILIAGNGSGKTTILNALHAFLRRRFHRLQSLEFGSIECEFCSSLEPVVLTKESIGQARSDVHDRVVRLSQDAGISEEELYDFLQAEYQANRRNVALRNHPIVRTLFTNTPMDYSDVFDTLDTLSEAILSFTSEALSQVGSAVAAALGEIEVLYLPTYRRIENPLLSPRGRLRRTVATRSRVLDQSVSSDTAHINFGLEDVESRLAQLSEEVERISNLEYRNASATIIDDALANKISLADVSTAGLPELESLKRFLSRVSREPRIDPHRASMDPQNERRISSIARLYESGEIASDDQRLLRYFLTRIGAVINRTKETEAMLQRFVEACNGYLSDSSDEKRFTYDQNLMRVAVINSWTDREIPLGQLSSGEKQIVSILAKLYLYERQKLILIDEPELSLSIDWQRRILPDMMRSGTVCQLLAITHSPFVFDNELDPFAGALDIERHRVGLF